MMRLAGPIIVGLTILGAILGPFVVPYDPAAQDLPLRLTGPSWSHLLGMDELGRDLLSRLLAGARISLLVGLAVVGVSSVVGTIVGSLAGYLGGWVDTLVGRVMDVLLCLAERAGEVVSRETLNQQVWGNIVVTDQAVTNCISELRHHLGEVLNVKLRPSEQLEAKLPDLGLSAHWVDVVQKRAKGKKLSGLIKSGDEKTLLTIAYVLLETELLRAPR